MQNRMQPSQYLHQEDMFSMEQTQMERPNLQKKKKQKMVNYVLVYHTVTFFKIIIIKKISLNLSRGTKAQAIIHFQLLYTIT
jgi:hypothetical protein